MRQRLCFFSECSVGVESVFGIEADVTMGHGEMAPEASVLFFPSNPSSIFSCGLGFDSFAKIFIV